MLWGLACGGRPEENDSAEDEEHDGLGEFGLSDQKMEKKGRPV